MCAGKPRERGTWLQEGHAPHDLRVVPARQYGRELQETGPRGLAVLGHALAG